MISTRNLASLLFTALLLMVAFSVFAQSPPGELLKNGGFEGGGGSDGKGAGVPRWDAFDIGYDIDRQTHRGGDQSIRCDSLRLETIRGAQCRIELDQKIPIPIEVSGWSRAEEVSGAPNSDYSVYVDMEYMDGTPFWGQFAPYLTGTHDWQHRQILIFPTKPVRSLIVYALFRKHKGTAWFDDFSAHQMEGDGIFDGQVLSPGGRPPLAGPTSLSVSAKDGLSLTLNSHADITHVRAGGQDVSGGGIGGFYLRDVAKDGQPVALRGGAQAYHRTGADFFSSPPGMGIHFYAKIVPDGDALAIDGEMTDVTNTDRAVTVYFALPVQADGWQWGQDIRHNLTLDSHQETAHLTHVNVGATGGLSLYPFGCISNSSHGIAIASQMDWPSVFRIFYNGPTHQFVIAWDFALTGKTAAWPSHNARFRCRLFSLRAGQADWGFRAAAQRFYSLNAPNFDRRAKAEGIWMPFTNPASVAKPGDFGFAYHEGDNSVKSDDALGILSFRYTEPMSWWMNMPKEMPRTYEAALGLAKQLSEDKGAKKDLREAALALFSSGTQDETGRFNLEFRNEPWADGAVFILNPNPELPSAPDRPTKASLSYSIADAIKRYGDEAKKTNGELDGEYLDSLEAWGDTLDYRPSNIQAISYPIPFETDSRKPVIPQWFSTHTFARFLRDDLHNRGKLLMANSVPIRFSIFAPLLDIMGIEVNWLDSNGSYSPESDETLSWRRTMSYQKPYLLLQNTNFDKFTAAFVEKYFQRSMFYGIYPSMFSADAATHPYWESPKWFNRDRPLFQTYIPIIKRLSAAGWEPITYAHTDNPKVYVERYGTRLFTVMNDSKQNQAAALTIDLNALHLPASAHVVNLKTRVNVPVQTAETTLKVSLSLSSGEAATLEIE